MDEQMNNKAVTVPGLCCSLACYGVLAGFFGTYWLNNPDSNYTLLGVDYKMNCWSSAAAGDLTQAAGAY